MLPNFWRCCTGSPFLPIADCFLTHARVMNVCQSLQVKKLHDIDLDRLHFVGESLGLLREEVGNQVLPL
jgi:hypothetical protein